jgi:hypothetical protein
MERKKIQRKNIAGKISEVALAHLEKVVLIIITLNIAS